MANKEFYFKRNLEGTCDAYQGRDNSFDKEVERYRIITEHFREHPSRFTEENKKNLERIFLRVLSIIKKDVPIKTEKSCLSILNYLSTKLDFKAD
jgi:hypothetical protein